MKYISFETNDRQILSANAREFYWSDRHDCLIIHKRMPQRTLSFQCYIMLYQIYQSFEKRYYLLALAYHCPSFADNFSSLINNE